MNMIRYEELVVKAVISVVVAMVVVFMGLMILGVELISCNFSILFGGVCVVAVIVWFMSVLNL